MSATDVQILNNPAYQRLVENTLELDDMIRNLNHLYTIPTVETLLIRGIETHLRLANISIRNAMKQMRGEVLV
jgi:hypothetical protein